MLGGVEVTAKAREHARDMLAAVTGSTGKGARGAGKDAAADTVRQKRPPQAGGSGK